MPSVEVWGETWLNMRGGSGSRLTHSWLYQRLNWPIGVMKRPTFRVIHLFKQDIDLGVADANAIDVIHVNGGFHQEPLVELHQKVGRDLHRA